MTSRERVLTALRGGTPDRVPVWEYLFSLKLQKEVMGYTTELYDGRTQAKMAATMDLLTVKQKYNGRICPIGNVNNKTTMVTGTPDDVIKETIECLKIGAPGGGYILSTDHSLHDDIPLENAMALIETVHKFGKYPLKIE
jgi:uroporphyrinogen-III decarboxylase